MTDQDTNRATGIALDALAWTLADPARAERLIALTGLTPLDLRTRIEQPALLGAVLRFLEAHEPDLVACAEAIDRGPADLVAARQVLDPRRDAIT